MSDLTPDPELQPTHAFGADYVNAHGEEHSRLAGLIINDIKGIRNLLLALVVVIFVSMAVITTNTVVAWRSQQHIKEFSQSNNRFLANFSSYMRCLVVVNEPLYNQLGKGLYFDTCDIILFRGTGLSPQPHTQDSTSTTNTTLGPTTGGSNILGG